MIEARPATRWRDLSRGGAAAILIVVLVGGVPWGLVSAAGWPLPHHIPNLSGIRTALNTRGIPDRTLIDVLACLAWLTWASVAVSLMEEVVATLKGRSSRRVPFASAFQPVAARLVTALLFAVLALARAETPATASAPAPLAHQLQASPVTLTSIVTPVTLTPVTSTSTSPTPSQSPSLQPTTPAVASPSTYTVVPNDTLWSIADSQLGDGADWPTIAALNLGRTMSDGRRFVDPNLIYPGWVLLMPGSGPVVAPAATESVPGAPPPTALSPSQPVSSTSRQDPSSSRRILPRRHTKTRLATHHPTGAVTRPESSNLPELVALGIGAIGSAALARRCRRLRLLRQLGESDPGAVPENSDAAIDTNTLLSRFAGVPALTTFESANCQLAHALSRRETAGSTPRFRAIRVSASGVDFFLQTSGLSAPGGFTLSDDGNAWHLVHDQITCSGASDPYLPIALPVGEDEAGTWLIPLTRGNCLPLLGEAADDLWLAARTIQEAWSWADLVLMTDDPRVVAHEVQLLSNESGPASHEQQILFFGDPQLLSLEQRSKVSIVTTSSAPASDVVVVVDHHAASIHPLGRTVRPHLFSGTTASAVTELMSTPTLVDHSQALISHQDFAHRIVNEDTHDGPSIRGAGIVEVKLLTMTPRLEGLQDPLPPNRARRAIELVAYLALHRPDVVTSDRLRTRVLGSADADAASKTLFNTASAARRAMGLDSAGLPLFPPGSRTGHYRVSEAVTIDVDRAIDLATMANTAEDPDEAMALLRAALELIEGEPLANALSGYTWWEAEGHGARIAAVIVNAACNLAALAVNAELFDLANWGLERARQVDPYSETISRAAMQVAAAAGDADALRREWRECQRRVDDLDPGGTPSPRTERLYGELSQRVLIRASGGQDD